MVEQLRIEVGHDPSNPTTGQKVRFFAQATGNVSRVEIFVNGRLATTCAMLRCHRLVGPFPAGPVTYFANAYGQTRMVSSGKRQLTVAAARPAQPPKPAVRVRPAKPPKPAKPPEPAVRARPAKPPEIIEGSTISGRLTGETDLIKEVSAINQDRGGERFTASVGARGKFKFSNLPDGHYRVYPVPRGKLEVISEPRYHEVRCRGRQSHSLNLEIKDIDRTWLIRS